MHIDAIFSAVGRFAVRFRWFVLLVWIIGAVAAVTQLPALSSVTQNNNSKFLPASAPSEHAAELAAPFGTANLIPIPVVVARSGSPLTPADVTAMTALQQQLRTVPTISRVLDAGRSADGQAGQLVLLAEQGGGNQNQQTDLVDALRAKISRAGLPADLHAHLAGDVAIQVDQQKASGNQGNEVQDLSIVFIVGLLVLIFRSLTLALTTIAPAVFSVIISGPLVAEAAHHGLQVSPLAQFLLIVLVLGAGTDYGLFLVFRVREELRAAGHGKEGVVYPGSSGVPSGLRGDLLHPRPAARQAIVRSVTKVGESITFSAATVIAAVLTLLLASFSFYSDLGIPFAIAIGVILLAGLTLLPALLSIQAEAAAVGHPGIGQDGGVEPGGRPDRPAARAHADHRRGGLRRACPGRARLRGWRLRRKHERARRQRLRRGHGSPHEAFPAVLSEPDKPDLPVRQARMEQPGAAGHRY